MKCRVDHCSTRARWTNYLPTEKISLCGEHFSKWPSLLIVRARYATQTGERLAFSVVYEDDNHATKHIQGAIDSVLCELVQLIEGVWRNVAPHAKQQLNLLEEP